MEASGGKIGFDQAKMQAGQEANLSESMKLALQQMDLRNAASLIASRQHEMTKPDNTERIVRGEERRRVEDAVAQARQVAAQYRVALSKMDLADQAMASPEAKKALDEMKAQAENLKQDAWNKANELMNNYSGVKVTRGQDGLPVVTMAMPSAQTGGTGAEPSGAKGKTVTMAEINRLARKSGKSPEEVLQLAKDSGWVVQEGAAVAPKGKPSLKLDLPNRWRSQK
jgi:hypothetical protein